MALVASCIAKLTARKDYKHIICPTNPHSDPNHKNGYRVVRVKKNKIYISLQDEPTGDVIDVVGTKKGDAYLIDFSSKGGPKDIEAKER